MATAWCWPHCNSLWVALSLEGYSQVKQSIICHGSLKLMAGDHHFHLFYTSHTSHTSHTEWHDDFKIFCFTTVLQIFLPLRIFFIQVFSRVKMSLLRKRAYPPGKWMGEMYIYTQLRMYMYICVYTCICMWHHTYMYICTVCIYLMLEVSIQSTSLWTTIWLSILPSGL